MIPFGPYRPDVPPTDAQSNEYVKNVIPGTGYYKPMKLFNAYTSALTNRCQGCVAMTDDDGDVYVIAGDATKLYTLAAGSTTWTEKGTGLSTATDGQWKFAKYGVYAVATNFVDCMLQWQLGAAGDFTTLVAEPKCRFIEVIKNFLFTGNTWDSVDGYVPYRVRWSALGDHTDFAYSKATQADFQDLSGDGGWVQGIVGGLIGADGCIFMDRAIIRVTYVSGNTIFQFDNVEGGIGTQASNSIVKAQGVAFFLGQDGFYMFDGINLIPIGKDKVDNTFFEDFDTTYYHRVWGSIDPTNTVVFWSYPSASAPAGVNDKILAFDYVAREWAPIEHNNELVVPSISLGSSLDDLDGLGYTDLDALPFSLDSRVWVGGDVRLAAFDANHKLGYYDGNSMAAELDTMEVRLGNQRSMITEVWPIVDGGAQNLRCQVGTRRYAPQTSVSFTATTTMNVVGFCPSRSEGRLHRARIYIPENTSWKKAKGVEFTFHETGGR